MLTKFCKLVHKHKKLIRQKKHTNKTNQRLNINIFFKSKQNAYVMSYQVLI